MPASRPRVAVLVSPTAGRGRAARQVGAVLGRISAGGVSPEHLRATTPADAVKECRRAVEDGVDAVVTVGGDGTVHLALQAVAGTATPLGMVPLGTGNDAAAALGIPLAVPVAVDAVLAAVHAGTAGTVDAVSTTADDGRHVGWWVAILSAGFDAQVNERANRMRWPRGPRRYDLAILAELARLAPHDVALELDGTAWSGPVTLVAVGNLPQYGGGMRMCPAADPTDGLLDVTVVGPVGRVELVRVKPRLYDGTHVTHPKVTTHRAATVRLAGARGMTFADGEPLAPLPLTATCVPGALRVLVAPA